MAVRTKTAITDYARKIVGTHNVTINSGDNPGDAPVMGSTSISVIVIILLLLILEVLLNIRQGETA